jgi:hypothetical protein
MSCSCKFRHQTETHFCAQTETYLYKHPPQHTNNQGRSFCCLSQTHSYRGQSYVACRISIQGKSVRAYLSWCLDWSCTPCLLARHLEPRHQAPPNRRWLFLLRVRSGQSSSAAAGILDPRRTALPAPSVPPRRPRRRLAQGSGVPPPSASCAMRSLRWYPSIVVRSRGEENRGIEGIWSLGLGLCVTRWQACNYRDYVGVLIIVAIWTVQFTLIYGWDQLFLPSLCFYK